MSTTTMISQPVGDIAALNPAVARVLESAGIDYCCSGRTTLACACASKGVDADQLLAQIEHARQGASPAERTWTDATMTELADHIQETHHAFVRAELPRLVAMARKVDSAHGARRPELAELAAIVADLEREMTSHMQKEEQVLFPALRTMEAGCPGPGASFGWIADGPIRCMMQEHDHAGRALERMRQLTGGYRLPPGACTTYQVLFQGLAAFEANLHEHVHKENNILFPQALRHLAPENPLTPRFCP